MKKITKLRLGRETVRNLTSPQLRAANGGQPIEPTNGGHTVCIACSPSDTLPSHCGTCDVCPDETVQATTCTVSASG